MWGPWQVGQMTAEDYSKRAAQWAKALKLLDPSLCLILCGETGHSSWDHEVLKACIPFVDMHSIHIYTSSNDHLQNVVAPLSAERAIETAAALIDIARIENNIPSSVSRTKICFDEWNVWDPVRAPGEQGAEELYTLSDALAVAVWLNVFVRQSKWVGMANIAQTVNVISPLMTTKNGIVRQATWWPLLLFSKFMRGWTVGVHVSAGAYDGKTQPAWLQGVLEQGASWLDVSACVNEEGVLSLVVVNINETDDFDVDLTGVGQEVAVYTVIGRNVKAVNVEGKEEVYVQESKWDGNGKFRFSKHSMSMLRWNTGKRVNEISKGDDTRLDTRKLAWTAE
jgi:alpha-N-arabinofuranosidase